jgi:hypothetical protein
MPEPITAATIVTLLLTSFVGGVAGEAGKQSVEKLWKAIAARFQNDDRAKRAMTAVETEKSPEAAKKLETYLDDEMTTAPEFAEALRQLVQEIQAQQPVAGQEMATKLELEGDLEVEDSNQRSNKER